MTTQFSVPICLACSLYKEDETCTAFPDGIPDSILLDGADHRKPIDGDHGTRFQLKEGAAPLLDLFDS